MTIGLDYAIMYLTYCDERNKNQTYVGKLVAQGHVMSCRCLCCGWLFKMQIQFKKINLTNEQKFKVYTAGVLLAVLLVTIIFQPFTPSLNNSSKLRATTALAGEDRRAYEDFKNSPNDEQLASQALFKQLVSEQEVKAELDQMLGVNQVIEIPEVKDEEIRIAGTTGRAVFENYTENINSLVASYNEQLPEPEMIFAQPGNKPAVERAIAVAAEYNRKLAALPTPREAIELQRGNLVIGRQMQQMFNMVANSNLENLDDPWPKEAYQHYAIMDNQVQYIQEKFDTINQKYAAKGLNILGIQIIKTAQAFAFIGSVRDFLKDLWALLWARFVTFFISRTMTRLEQNLVVSSVMYYTDSLVAAQYVPDYLKKYVTGSDKGSTPDIDKKILQKLAFSAGCNAFNQTTRGDNLKSVYSQQSRDYLGFVPSEVRFDDPNSYKKMADAADPNASPWMRKLMYEDRAAGLAASARESALVEQTGTQYKSARKAPEANKKADPNTPPTPGNTTASTEPSNSIGRPSDNFKSAVQASLQGLLDVGNGNPESLAAKIAAGIISVLFNNFIFKNALVIQDQLDCAQLINKKDASNSEGNIKLTKEVRNITPLSPYLSGYGKRTRAVRGNVVQYKVVVSATKDLTNVIVEDKMGLGISCRGSVLVNGQTVSWARCINGGDKTKENDFSRVELTLDKLGTQPVEITYEAVITASGTTGLELVNSVNARTGTESSPEEEATVVYP